MGNCMRRIKRGGAPSAYESQETRQTGQTSGDSSYAGGTQAEGRNQQILQMRMDSSNCGGQEKKNDELHQIGDTSTDSTVSCGAGEDPSVPKVSVQTVEQALFCADQSMMACGIQSIPDPILSHIFAYLPLTERLRASEVCTRWNSITRLDWLDVLDLDVTPIPSPNIGAVLRASPNVESLFAARRMLVMPDLVEHYQTNLLSVKLYDVSMGLAAIKRSGKHTAEHRNVMWLMQSETKWPRTEFHFANFPIGVTLNPPAIKTQVEALISETINKYLEKLPQLEELVLHNIRFTDLQQVPVTSIIPFSLSTPQLNTISRLQLSGAGVRDLFYARPLTASLRELRQLECLILHVNVVVEPTDRFTDATNVDREVCGAIGSLKGLRELSVATAFRRIRDDGVCEVLRGAARRAAETALTLPKLEALFLIDQRCGRDTFKSLILHPPLRVLMLAGGSRITGGETIMLPPRNVFAEGARDAAPILNVFVRANVPNEFRIPTLPGNEANVFVFDMEIETLLGCQRFESVFDDFWISEAIRDTAGHGPFMWRADINAVV